MISSEFQDSVILFDSVIFGFETIQTISVVVFFSVLILKVGISCFCQEPTGFVVFPAVSRRFQAKRMCLLYTLTCPKRWIGNKHS